MTKLINKIIIYAIFPLNILIIIIGYYYPNHGILKFKYEIFLFVLLLFSIIRKFKTSSNFFFLFGIALLILSLLFYSFNKDNISVYMSDLALIYLVVGTVNLFLYEIKKPKNTVLNKRVLFIANAIVGKDPGVSGGESRFIELGKQWKANGYEIHLLAAKSGETLCIKMGLDVILHCVSKSDNDSRLEFIIRTIKVLFYLPSILNDFDEGIVYSTSEQFYDTLPGCILKLVYPDRILFATAVHWLPPVQFWKRKSSKIFNSLLFLISERLGILLSFLSADSLFPVSESTFEDMKKSGFFNEKVSVVKCGVNLNKIKPVTAKYDHKINDAVFMKRTQAVKGIFDLIDIWSIVVKTLPNAKLVVIGSGIDEREAHEIVEKRNLNKNIIFTGVIYDFERKFKEVCESRLFLLPSYEENWAIVIGEALAAGTPVICYDLKELRDVWGDSVEFVDVGNKDKFAQRTLELLKNKKLYEETVSRGLKYVEQYDWEIIATEELSKIISGK